MRTAMRIQVCERAPPHAVPFDVLSVVTARTEIDRMAGDTDFPQPDNFVTTDAVDITPRK